MADNLAVQDCIDTDLFSTAGEKIGAIKDVYLDTETREPEWFAVGTGLFGSHVTFVPLGGATRTEDAIAVPYTKKLVKDAPHIEPDGQLSTAEEATLYQHYGLGYSTQTATGRQGRSASGQSGSTDQAMTRSEEELVAGKRQKEAGRVKLVKWVETEHRTVTIPIKRERATLVREPITDENRDEAMSGPDIRSSVHEETLYEEEPVIGKRTVPKERVRLEKETEIEDREVGVDLRKEQIRTEGDDVEAKSRR